MSIRSGLPLIIGIGVALTAVGGWITSLLHPRIDRAMAALMRSAERIGSGKRSGTRQPSGVPEISALEDSLEQHAAGPHGDDDFA